MDLILVVLYKQTVSESNTLLSLLNCKERLSEKLLFVWDNSPYPLDSSDIFILEDQFKKFKYFNSKDNKSLSEVYNTVIKHIKFDKIFIFDQDTTLTDQYFKLVDFAADSNPEVGLFLPFVKNEGRIVSPLFYKVINFNHFKNLNYGKTVAKDRTAFASGLCIRESVFKNYEIWFDENLKFYGIDYKFTLDYGDVYRYMYVINYELNHNLSFAAVEGKETKLRRFDSNIGANFYLAKQRLNLLQIFIVLIRGVITSVRMSIHYREFKFYHLFYKNFVKIFFKKNVKTD